MLFVCLMTGTASGRELECHYGPWSTTLHPTHKRCYTDQVDYSAKFEAEKHTFSGSVSDKSETKTFQIWRSPKVDFIPLDILMEFPKLNGLDIYNCNLPTLKSGLFKKEFQKIEFLKLEWNRIEKIEPEAFQYLIKLKWVRLYRNNLKTLSTRLFGNSPDLIYIDLESNQMNAIHPNFFDGLEKLKLIDFEGNLCIRTSIGCETCLVAQAELNSNLQKCFENCSIDSICS
jgi:hypothetical protein